MLFITKANEANVETRWLFLYLSKNKDKVLFNSLMLVFNN